MLLLLRQRGSPLLPRAVAGARAAAAGAGAAAPWNVAAARAAFGTAAAGSVATVTAGSSHSHGGASTWGRAVFPAAVATLLVGSQVAQPTSVSEAKAATKTKDVQPPDITLYGYDTCPFCNKVKAYLDYRKMPYKWVEVNPLTKSEIRFSKEYKKVPIFVMDGQQFNNSDDIIDVVDGALVESRGPVKRRGFFGRSKRAAAVVGAGVMYMVSKKYKKQFGFEDERTALYEAADKWIDALGNREFMGTSSPNKADLAMFGVLRSIEGLSAFTYAPPPHTGY
eukprot:scaffold1659_cov371-Prasinococcus_capsulatus_cf.AAC.9